MVHASNLESIKKKLRARKAELEAELLRLSRERVYEESIPDPSDQASLSTLEEVNISLENNERDEYSMILRALEMLEQGTYGMCTECNQEISEKRLNLYPNATRCLPCQEAVEERT